MNIYENKINKKHRVKKFKNLCIPVSFQFAIVFIKEIVYWTFK